MSNDLPNLESSPPKEARLQRPQSPIHPPTTRVARGGLPGWVSFVGVVAFIVVGVVAVRFLKATAPEPPVVKVEPLVPSVQIMKAVASPQKLSVRVQGIVQPRTETTLVAEVAGSIVEVSEKLEAGSFFKKGELLLRMDPRDYESALATALAGVARAEADLATEKAEARQARLDWDRLGRGGQPSDLLLRLPQLARAEASLTSARAALEKAKNDLDRTFVRAPYDGRSREKMAEVGQFANAGAVLGRIFATDYVEIRLPLSDEQIARLDPTLLAYREGEWNNGPTVRFESVVAGRLQTWEGRLTRMEGVVDPKSRFYYAVARVDDPYGVKQPRDVPMSVGMFVEAEVSGRELLSAISLPRTAVHPGNRVYVVEEQNGSSVLRVLPVSLVAGADGSDDSVLIDGGLPSGVRVVTSPLAVVVEGMTVAVVDSSGQTKSVDAVSSNIDPSSATKELP